MARLRAVGRDLQKTPFLRLAHVLGRQGHCGVQTQALDILGRTRLNQLVIGAKVTAARLEGHHLAQQRFGCHQLGRQIQQFALPRVAQLHTPFPVEHHHAL